MCCGGGGDRRPGSYERQLLRDIRTAMLCCTHVLCLLVVMSHFSAQNIRVPDGKRHGGKPRGEKEREGERKSSWFEKTKE